MSVPSFADYGPLVRQLWRGAGSRTLGPGIGHVGQRESLDAMTPQAVVAPHPVSDREMALACCAGLWLRHDFLDRAHAISQEIDTPSGSFWHGIVHRREGDYSNAKYWFRHVGRHEVFASLAVVARELVEASPLANRAAALFATGWDPLAFVDWCQRGASSPGDVRELCLAIQEREWELLFDHCYRRAMGQQ